MGGTVVFIQDLMKLTAAGTALELHEVPFLIPTIVVTKAGAKKLIFEVIQKNLAQEVFTGY